ncbi:hypothetical protein [Nannocystis pusilla]|uniref:hypothetical protein n=1 Tax=Nannocystis pusilla TaxID=889268 RepID=UPI003B77913A
MTLHELPHGRLVRTLGFELAGATLGMADDGSMLVVQQGAQVEVRTADGALVRRCGSKSEAVGRRGWHDPAPRFSRDGRRVAARVGKGWRIWTLASGEEERVEDGAGDDLEGVADFAAPRPSGWKLEGGKFSVFIHEASGTTIALPVRGGWQFNPADPRICICNELLVVLEG